MSAPIIRYVRGAAAAFLALILGGLAPVARAQETQERASTATRLAQTIASAKVIVGDLKRAQSFYEQFFGFSEVSRSAATATAPEEVLLGFASGARLALVAPAASVEAALPKSQFPVVLIRTPDFDALTKRLEDAGQRLQRLSGTGTLRIAITRDPSGNAVEILAGTGAPAVGGAKLIVADRQRAEDFYVRVLGAQPTQRFKTGAYDEVLLGFGSGPFLALFEPKQEAPFAKSRFPVVAIATSELDAVAERMQAAGLAFERSALGAGGPARIVARDPRGNAFEIVAR
jgi:catechol 2,3-dioxygenase-like lactoylglutathione lyase family enzyme